MARILVVIVLLSTILLSACAIEPEAVEPGTVEPGTVEPGTGDHAGMESTPGATMGMAGHKHPMAPLEDMPEMVRDADARTQEAYRFATANPDAAAEVPCYCGCVGLGHASSADCYLAEMTAGTVVEYDMHAVNCTVCVDITQDQMRMMDNGDPPEVIRAFLADNYAKYGPPTE